jgi:hypothetical protein
LIVSQALCSPDANTLIACHGSRFTPAACRTVTLNVEKPSELG